MNWKRHLPPANTRLIVSDGENVGIARYINDTRGKVWFFEGIAPLYAADVLLNFGFLLDTAPNLC